MAQRVTLRKRQPYNTTSNRRRVVKTPGGKLVYHHIGKLATAPKCGDCGIALPGVSTETYPPILCRTYALDLSRFLLCDHANMLPSPRRGRLYGEPTAVPGVETVLRRGMTRLRCDRSHILNPNPRILRAFLVEEAKIVKKVIKSQQKGGRK